MKERLWPREREKLGGKNSGDETLQSLAGVHHETQRRKRETGPRERMGGGDFHLNKN